MCHSSNLLPDALQEITRPDHFDVLHLRPVVPCVESDQVAFILPLLTIYLGHCFPENLYFSAARSAVCQACAQAPFHRLTSFIGFIS
jgi:hypothetical protein